MRRKASPNDLFAKKKKSTPPGQTDLVIKNGLQFIERGVNELWDKKDKRHLKHSVINFYTGIELLLKARLMMEHWSLIVSETKSADAISFVRGDFRSVGLDEAVSRLRKIAGLDVNQATISAFRDLQSHRNQMVHFFHKTDLRTKEGRQLRSQVINEQCAGWFYLQQLIGETWADKFELYSESIEKINGLMKPHRAYLESVYKKIEPELSKEEEKGADLGNCYACGFSAHVVKTIGPSESHCRVCSQYGAFLRYKCDDCDHIFLIEDGFDKVNCPECKTQIERDEVMGAFSDEGEMLPEAMMIDGGYGNCAECCGSETVGTFGEGSFCFQCHLFSGPMGVCDWCGEKATGDLTYSNQTGCVMCDGHGGWDKD